jgi:hypothetical protein
MIITLDNLVSTLTKHEHVDKTRCVDGYQETKIESYKNSCQIQSSVKFIGHHLQGDGVVNVMK